MAMNTRATLPLVLMSRKMTTSAVVRAQKLPVHPGFAKNKAKCDHFQLDNGVPIHLKGGIMDRILYMTTLALCGVGLVQCFAFYYDMSFPKKPDSSDSC